MRPSGGYGLQPPPGAQDLWEVLLAGPASFRNRLQLDASIVICEQDYRLSAYARGCVGCGSTAVEDRPLESQEPSRRGNIVRSAIPASRPGRTAGRICYWHPSTEAVWA